MSLRDPGQIPKIRDCPGDSGTVGAYESERHADKLIQTITIANYIYKLLIEHIICRHGVDLYLRNSCRIEVLTFSQP